MEEKSVFCDAAVNSEASSARHKPSPSSTILRIAGDLILPAGCVCVLMFFCLWGDFRDPDSEDILSALCFFKGLIEGSDLVSWFVLESGLRFDLEVMFYVTESVNVCVCSGVCVMKTRDCVFGSM